MKFIAEPNQFLFPNYISHPKTLLCGDYFTNGPQKRLRQEFQKRIPSINITSLLNPSNLDLSSLKSKFLLLLNPLEIEKKSTPITGLPLHKKKPILEELKAIHIPPTQAPFLDIIDNNNRNPGAPTPSTKTRSSADYEFHQSLPKNTKPSTLSTSDKNSKLKSGKSSSEQTSVSTINTSQTISPISEVYIEVGKELFQISAKPAEEEKQMDIPCNMSNVTAASVNLKGKGKGNKKGRSKAKAKDKDKDKDKNKKKEIGKGNGKAIANCIGIGDGDGIGNGLGNGLGNDICNGIAHGIGNGKGIGKSKMKMKMKEKCVVRINKMRKCKTINNNAICCKTNNILNGYGKSVTLGGVNKMKRSKPMKTPPSFHPVIPTLRHLRIRYKYKIIHSSSKLIILSKIKV